MSAVPADPDIIHQDTYRFPKAISTVSYVDSVTICRSTEEAYNFDYMPRMDLTNVNWKSPTPHAFFFLRIEERSAAS